MRAFVELVEIKKTSAGKDYLVLYVNDGVKKDSFCVWNPPADFCVSKLKDKVVTAELRVKGEFKSCDYSDLFTFSIENEPEGSPLKNIKFRSDVTKEEFVKAALSCSKLFTHDKFRNFLKYVDVNSLANIYGDTPAALKVHHAIKGGLIEHVYEMLSLYYNMAKSSLVRDLRHEFIIFAILFHDYGKTKEYNLEKWETTEMYPLLGHVYYSSNHLSNLIRDYNEEIKLAKSKELDTDLDYSDDMIITDMEHDCMVHCILAHHGKLEWGSPVVPAIPEALVMHCVDLISGDLNQFRNAENMEKSFFLGTRVVKNY